MRDQCHIAQFHCVPVVKHTIDFTWRIERSRLIPILEVSLTTRFDDVDVGVHDHVRRTCEPLDLSAASVVVPMRVVDQENPDVTELESEFFDARPNERNAPNEIAVDENVSSRRRYEITRQVFASYVLEISDYTKWRKWFCPLRPDLGV